MAVARHILAKLFQVAIVLFAVAVVTFTLLNLLPGNEAAYRVGILPGFTEAQRAQLVAAMTRQMGLDKPLPIQFFIWLGNAVQGNFGLNFQGEPVRYVLGPALSASAELAVAGLIPSLIAATLLATWAFRTRWRKAQAVLQALMSALFVIPSFWLAFLVVIAFSVKWPILPSTGYVPLSQSVTENLKYLVLPALTLACPLTALFFRYLLAGMEEAAMGAYVVAARAKGISERAVVYRHILPNGSLPAITIIGLATASLLGSLVVIEQSFSWPGLGLLLWNSIQTNDYNSIVAVVLITAAAFVFTSFLVDLAYWLVDPRTRRVAVA